MKKQAISKSVTANRETWLHKAVVEFRKTFKGKGYTIPDRLQVSCGWPSRSVRKVIGQAFDAGWTTDKTNHIFISPILGEDPTRVLDVLIHELIHVSIGCDKAHGKEFKAAMKLLGLEGKATATTASEELKADLVKLVEKLGEYPHATMHLTPDAQKKTRNKSGAYVRLVSEENPGYSILIAKTFIEEFGAPLCPISNKPMVQL